ncbi:hypothetical protein [Pseudophaeobacter sp.]|uniref:hypothetical protein n=1 Tax=Pseudophaeobacter sp. TaxID=1971739 RepID=UPI0021FA7AA7|nr:hypothetical protein [Pseudophaeobacter sp.]UWS81883.1 hypothetical protein N1037_21870 [Phaeobacter sp. G2]
MLASQITLTPLSATILIFLAVLAGNRYRRVWKAEGPRWQLWLFGLIAAAALLTLGFVPMAPG